MEKEFYAGKPGGWRGKTATGKTVTANLLPKRLSRPGVASAVAGDAGQP